jgi:hypothetical protein
MHAVVRSYSGENASVVFDLIERDADDIGNAFTAIPGFISYTAIRTADGGVTVTVCDDKNGTDESSKRAAELIKERTDVMINPPEIMEGDTSLHVTR